MKNPYQDVITWLQREEGERWSRAHLASEDGGIRNQDLGHENVRGFFTLKPAAGFCAECQYPGGFPFLHDDPRYAFTPVIPGDLSEDGPDYAHAAAWLHNTARLR